MELRPIGAQKLQASMSLSFNVRSEQRERKSLPPGGLLKSLVFNVNVVSFPDLIDGRENEQIWT